jgi:phosphosulfolactate synthase
VSTPSFLDLPHREGKPRSRGLSHVLDKGLSPAATDALLEHADQLVDVVKVGWGIGYVDRCLPQRVARYSAAGVLVSLGGTLLEVAARQGRVDQLRDWALEIGMTAVEVSNGLGLLSPAEKTALVAALSTDFVVAAEVGSKDAAQAVVASDWVAEMQADLEAGATWVIAEGRESGTVGLYQSDGAVRDDLVGRLIDAVPVEHIIFEAPTKAQQAWFVRRLGADVNLGNIPPDELLALETLRLGLRADTALQPVVASR